MSVTTTSFAATARNGASSFRIADARMMGANITSTCRERPGISTNRTASALGHNRRPQFSRIQASGRHAGCREHSPQRSRQELHLLYKHRETVHRRPASHDKMSRSSIW
jgi:hypothetical protein